MKTKSPILPGLLTLVAGLSVLDVQFSTAFAQGNAFTYQGWLADGAGPASGTYDFRFTAYDSGKGGATVGSEVKTNGVAVSNGLFMATLDLGGNVFTGSARWLQIEVRTNGALAFTALTPRQPLTPSPYALYAPSAGTAALASGVAAGSITSAALAPGSVTGTAIAPGAVGSTHLPASVPYLDASSQTFSGQNAFNTLVVDPFTNNNGTVGSGLTFGSLGSGEGIGSKRTAGGNQYGLDFYTYAAPQMSITSSGNVGIGTTSPTAKLEVKGTVTASNFVGSAAGLTNLNVANGSIDLVKLAPDVQFARAPYVTGVTSSQPQQLKWQISIDGVVTDPPAMLAQPYEEGRYVMESWVADPQIGWRYRLALGARIEAGRRLVLRRIVTDDPTWLNYRLTWTTNGQLIRHSVRLELRQAAVTVARWDFSEGVVYAHNYRLAADRLPVEEISIGFADFVSRQVDPISSGLPTGTGAQVGFNSGQPPTTRYVVRMDGTSWGETSVVSSDVAEASLLIRVVDELLRERAYLGRTTPEPILLRQSPFAANDLWTWCHETLIGSTLTPRTLELTLGGFYLQRCVGAFPTSYKLAIGDDGVPYEEYRIHYEAVAGRP